MKNHSQLLRDVIRAARIEYAHYKATPRPITWGQAMTYAWRSVRETRKLDALFAELAA